VLAVAVCAVMAGACTFAAIVDWVDDLDASAWGRLGFTGRVPVLTTAAAGPRRRRDVDGGPGRLAVLAGVGAAAGAAGHRR